MIKALAAVFICIISWAFIPIASKEILRGMNNYAMLFFSNIISALVLGVYLFAQNGIGALKKYSAKDYFIMSFLGFLGSFLFYVFLYKAFSLASAQEVFIINYTWPILITVFGFFILKERATLISLLAITISFLGVIVIATKGNLSTLKLTNLYADMLALLAATCFALFSVLGKKVKYEQKTAVFVYFLSASIFSLATVKYFRIRLIDTNTLFWLFINGAIINGVSYIFWFYALKKAKTALVSNLVYLTPLFSLIFISLILKERIEPYSIAALFLIMAGIGLQLAKKPT
ncbi:DMT family transporter [Hippea sp. KM1]|uniref:DMT family transporter n=1 Tax=Hippea sp. KM1 TaxID=944481 RepID=UPI00046CE518|nr:DMT family transporter [Hippea sp. KM1]